MKKASYLYLAIISGYFSEIDWQRWADQEILNNNVVEYWVYDISLAKTVDEVCGILYEKSLEECYYEYDVSTKEDVIVGYYYMLYREKRIDLYELISRLSDEDDISTNSTIHNLQNFYNLFLRINKNPNLLKDENFCKSIELLFRPFVKLAEYQKEELEYYF